MTIFFLTVSTVCELVKVIWSKTSPYYTLIMHTYTISILFRINELMNRKKRFYAKYVTCWIGCMENREWILWSWRSSSFAVSSSSGGVRSRRDGSSRSGLHDCKSKMLLKKIKNKKNGLLEQWKWSVRSKLIEGNG